MEIKNDFITAFKKSVGTLTLPAVLTMLYNTKKYIFLNFDEAQECPRDCYSLYYHSIYKPFLVTSVGYL